MHRGMSFNLQKDRPARAKLSELVWFMVHSHADVIGLNEAYSDVATVKRAIRIVHDAPGDDWLMYHPHSESGQSWNAVLWNTSRFKLINKRVPLLSPKGWPASPSPRWGTFVLLESIDDGDVGEQYAWLQWHWPPNLERRLAWVRTRARWQCANETARRGRTFMTNVIGKRYPHAHRFLVGDQNVDSRNKSNRWFPARYLGDYGYNTIWTPRARKQNHGTHGRRYIDDAWHTPTVEVPKVLQMTAHEKSDHNPPLFDFQPKRRLRTK